MKTLKTRIVVTLCLFSLILSLIFAGIAILASVASQDYVFNNTLRHITQQAKEHYLDDLPLSNHFPPEVSVHIGLTDISEEDIIFYRLESLPDGIYETNSPVDVHYSISTIEGRDEKLFVFLDVHDFEFEHNRLVILIMQLGIPAVLTAMIGAITGILLAKRVISPVTDLAGMVRRTTPENLDSGFSEGFGEDEVGELARSIDSTYRRLAQFIEREQQFTRNVSHELRTPLAVIKNGSELLRSGKGNINTQVLDRIDRAIVDMEQLVETFLFLAREKDPAVNNQSCDLNNHISKLFLKYAFLAHGRNISHQIQSSTRQKTGPVVLVNPEILDIMLGNCIRNAYQYSADGTIVVKISDEKITISNDIDKEFQLTSDRPYQEGIGHAITSRLCAHLNWIFRFEHDDEKATVSLTFQNRS